MDQTLLQILVILVFYQKITSGAVQTIKEGDPVDISCKPGEMGTMIIWFRVLDNSGMEFIASFSTSGMLKKSTDSFSNMFMDSKMKQNILTLKSFNKARDSGIYSCGLLHKGTELKFGEVTRLVGVEVPAEATRTTAKPSQCTSTTACVCNNDNKQGTTNPSLFCPSIILGPLAGGCGLLLLLLIITTLYCNKIRTRRCPHHHKRKPRAAPEKQVKTSRYV
ncbi:T-cell surface glycoprotein CD8 alpha chain [Micropterus salmoides]|uniref:T-cell surface glycoprotein CD8 alpha chain n=1 Tax=Micropterus salmoides TaxID=27706 RepID=UPI0018EABF1C|nr:T-cell surface glycoprotein CD8 alpha chain [Micropterus salmoides]XP_038552331.1 T-cell surface glycoprotein CD8 alpha chain [Micropterus salmoides]